MFIVSPSRLRKWQVSNILDWYEILYDILYMYFNSVLKYTLYGDKNNVIKIYSRQVMVAHAFNPSTWEGEAGGSLGLKPAWST